MKNIVIHHSADFDGLFCREIARKFLPDAELIGWDFKDEPLDMPQCDTLYVMDLPLDKPFGFTWDKEHHSIRYFRGNVVWIDHHKSAIDSHPKDIPGYRIDGVAACRLAWQWFVQFEQSDFRELHPPYDLPLLKHYIDREVPEPLAVRLAGEYDIWDKRDPRAELFQHGLRSRELTHLDWTSMLWLNQRMSVAEVEGLVSVGHQGMLNPDGTVDNPIVIGLLQNAKVVQYVRDSEYRDVITQQGFDVEFEGLKFLACNSHELDIRSHLFAAGIKPEHDALLGFTYNGVKKDWRVSMYHAPGKEHHDLSLIAVKHGGGGHRGACGFRADKLPFL